MSHGKSQKGDPRDLLIGAALQCMEAGTLGMPFEVWKTQQISSMRTGKIDSAAESFHKLWSGGIGRFYKGTGAKLVESGAKGGVLFFATQLTLDVCENFGMQRKGGWAGLISGFCGGVTQTIVMSPMTYIITYKNNNPMTTLSSVGILREAGFVGMYRSAPAMAMRQGSNWALRAALAQGIGRKYQQWKGSKMNKMEEVACGILGGCVACINQPTEVLRVVVQYRQAKGEKGITTRNSASFVYKHYGFLGFYAGLIPRMGLSAWQTLFMVTIAGFVKDAMLQAAAVTEKLEEAIVKNP